MNGVSTPEAVIERGWLEWGGLRTPGDAVLPALLALALAAWTLWQYRRDAAGLSRRLAATLTALRLGALALLLVVWLEPQWRTQRDVRIDSRVAVLVDTSLSMQLPGGGEGGSEAPRDEGLTTRYDEVQRLLDSPLLERLRRTHDVSIYRFDSSVERLALLGRQRGAAASDAPTAAAPWRDRLAPQGVETRLGEALRDALAAERARPLSGVVLVTDGAQTSGLSAEVAAAEARADDVRLMPIGLGASRMQVSVQVADLTAPPRALPGDPFTVTGYLAASGLAGKAARVELLWKPAGDDQAAATTLGARDVELPADGEPLPVRFEVTPAELGRRTLELRVVGVEEPQDTRDDHRTAEIEIVDRKLRVLLAAGGPGREYQYLRGVLHRDREVALDAYLQTAAPGASQDAATLLAEFPATPAELEPYDVIVAIDCDWTAIGAAAVESLERWVAEQAGGLILVAGPVNTERWAQRDDAALLARLFPVEFSRRLTLASLSTASTRPRAVRLTSAGREADFLQLADHAEQSADAWQRFEGVFGQQAVRRAKPGATIYATADDPTLDESGNVLLAGQFYGAGSVFYLGTAELWRLRRLGEGYFERLYTQIIRHVAEGRLARGSSRGVLLANHDRSTVGQAVEVELRLAAALAGGAAPTAVLEVVAGDGSLQRLTLEPSEASPLSYRGAWTPTAEGDYRLEAVLPDASGQRLTRTVSVRLPDAERQRPQRNDALLSRLAERTAGKYFVGVDAALAPGGVVDGLPDRSLVQPQLQEPRPLWDNAGMLGALVALLSAEWLIRRLARLG